MCFTCAHLFFQNMDSLRLSKHAVKLYNIVQIHKELQPRWYFLLIFFKITSKQILHTKHIDMMDSLHLSFMFLQSRHLHLLTKFQSFLKLKQVGTIGSFYFLSMLLQYSLLNVLVEPYKNLTYFERRWWIFMNHYHSESWTSPHDLSVVATLSVLTDLLLKFKHTHFKCAVKWKTFSILTWHKVSKSIKGLFIIVFLSASTTIATGIKSNWPSLT